MKDLLDKLSSYNIFNYLFPGVIFACLLENVTTYKVLQEDIVIGVFIYYFFGLVISRIGSLIIEPFLKMIGFVKFTPYDAYIEASKNDTSLETLSEVNNMYRTLAAMLFTIAVIVIYKIVSDFIPILKIIAPYISAFGIFLIFLFSYKKQTQYISRRSQINLK